MDTSVKMSDTFIGQRAVDPPNSAFIGLLTDSKLQDSRSPFKSIQVRYRKDPHMQNSMRKLKLTLTSPDPNR